MFSKRSKFIAGLKKAVETAKTDPETHSRNLKVAESPCRNVDEEDFQQFLRVCNDYKDFLAER